MAACVIIEMKSARLSVPPPWLRRRRAFRIAKVAAKLAIGYTLDELKNEITQIAPGLVRANRRLRRHQDAALRLREIPRRGSAADHLDEIGRRSDGDRPQLRRMVQKALRSMETGLTGFNEVDDSPTRRRRQERDPRRVGMPTPDRLLTIAQAYRHGLTTAEIHAACKYDPWFLDAIAEIVAAENELRAGGLPADAAGLLRAKRLGFSDARLAELTGTSEALVSAARSRADIHPVYKRIDTCAAEFPALTPYMYSTYEPECEAAPSARDKAIILGGGPNRIGQGIEFDYCCVHAAYSLKEAGIETIMVNCNPETVSTDYDTSDRLYFEPLTGEDVIEIVRVEQRRAASSA